MRVSSCKPLRVPPGFPPDGTTPRTSPARGAAIRTGLESSPGLAQEEEKTMARKDPDPKADRRRFLTGVVAAGAATPASAVSPPVRSADVVAQAPRAPPAVPPPRKAPRAEARA